MKLRKICAALTGLSLMLSAMPVSLAQYDPMYVDISRSIDVVTVSEDGELSINKDDLATIFDIVPFDSESNTGDYIFARYANKGTLQEMYLYRFE